MAGEKHRFTVTEYHLMGEIGIFGEDDYIKLLNGAVVDTPRIGSSRAGSMAWLNTLFHRTYSDRVLTSVRNPIILDEYSEPQPDITLLRPRANYYADGHPTPPDTFLIIEIAQFMPDYHRLVKVPLYAPAGIAEVWIVNLCEGVVATYDQPENGVYTVISTARRGDTVKSRTVAGLGLEVGAIPAIPTG